MIESLKIQNFILADNIEINFGKGLQILSGETGAGKSVIIGALNYLLGEKALPNLTHAETDRAYLEAVFLLDLTREELITKLNEFILIEDSPELIVSREIFKDGSSRSFLNGRRTSISIIREVKELIIDFHSQRDQVKLFNPHHQLEILDIYGNLRDSRRQFSCNYYELRDQKRKLLSLKEGERLAAEKNRLYTYQIEELEELHLKAGEEVELLSELDILTKAEEIIMTCSEMQQLFFEKEGSFYDQINTYAQRFSRFSSINKDVSVIGNLLENVIEQVKELSLEAGRLSSLVDTDRGKLETIERRLEEIIRVKTKYKMEVAELIDYLNHMKTVVSEMTSKNEEIERLASIIEEKGEQLSKMALKLSLDRKQASEFLKKDVSGNIVKLSMPDSGFAIEFDFGGSKEHNSLDISETGIDKVDFLFSANKGVPLRPLKNAVSGGELSRLQLVMKSVLAGRMDTLSLVFDEIDSGIGGRTANSLAKFLKEVSRYHQVICITHLPQIASESDKHFHIDKVGVGDQTIIRMKELDENGRREELARMLSGTRTDLALKHAEELLNKD